MGLGPASRGLNDVTTETRVFRQVSQLPEMSSVLFASAWVTLARPLAAPRRGSLSESSAARAVRTGRGAQRRDRGVCAPGASESGRGAAVRPGLEAQLPRGSRGSRRASPWSPGPGRDDAKRPLGCASQLDTRVVVTRSVTRSVPGAGRHDLGEREWASPWRHFPPTRVLRKPSAGRPQSET